jgi:hypothetical protein
LNEIVLRVLFSPGVRLAAGSQFFSVLKEIDIGLIFGFNGVGDGGEGKSIGGFSGRLRHRHRWKL